MNDFLPDATDFTDMAKRAPTPEYTVECPVCHGYGGWNLELNAYPSHHRCMQHGDNCADKTCRDSGRWIGWPGDRAPEQRHFRAFCRQCWGWGFVRPGVDATCTHTFVEIAPDQPWRCWHTIQCTKCKTTRSYDSSD